MTKELLIEKLNELPDGMEVCILDYRQNLSADLGEGSAVGVHADFDVHIVGEDELPEESPQWIALSFQNDDYTEGGTRND